MTLESITERSQKYVRNLPGTNAHVFLVNPGFKIILFCNRGEGRGESVEMPVIQEACLKGYGGVLQRVAAYCSVLQRVAACCRVLPCVAVCCRVLQGVAMCCSMLQLPR